MSSPDHSTILPQRLLALPFLVFGGWCIVAPAPVESLGLRQAFQHQSATTHVLLGCVGAQAVLSGIFAMFSRFTATTFLAYGIALLPFFWFNYHFVYVQPMFNRWMALDFVSNAFMLACCIWGYRRAQSASGA